MCSNAGSVTRSCPVRAATGSTIGGISACARRGARAALLASFVLTSAAASFGSPVETSVALPTVPPPHVRFPGSFDEHGCALIAQRAAQAKRLCPAGPATTARTEGWSRHLGFEGPRVASRVHGTGVVLLLDTVSVASRGWWAATGLVRNDAIDSAREVRVSVTLSTAHDRVLGTATVVVPVRDVRPGEPAPFELRTLVPVEAVRRVDWRVTSEAAEDLGASRMAEIEIGRIGADRVGREAPPRRSVLVSAAGAAAEGGRWIGWGVLRNWGPRPLRQPAVVGMWIDERGRAVRLVHGRVRDLRDATALPSRGTRTFELFEGEADAPHGAGWRLALWQTTR